MDGLLGSSLLCVQTSLGCGVPCDTQDITIDSPSTTFKVVLSGTSIVGGTERKVLIWSHLGSEYQD